MVNYESLVKQALEVRKKAYAPYSNFMVGSALLGESGAVYAGCNVESAAFSPTNCAERTALFTAIAQGERKFLAVAIVGAPEDGEISYCYPCGVCRQALKEFVNDDFLVIVAKSLTEYKVHTFGELLPHSFGPDNL